METKVCSKCEIEKNVCEFGKLKSSKDGYRHFCRECRKNIEKKYEGENVLLRKKKWRDNNKTKIKNHYFEVKDKISEYQKKYRNENSDKVRERKKEYYENNKELIKLKFQTYRRENKTKRNENEKIKKKNNSFYNILTGMRSRLCSYILKKGFTKNNKTFDIVGCSPEFLKEHLEKQFISGMTWENRNKWHIDHIIPLSSAKTEDELYKLCHYTNLQPLWAEDNLKKSNKIFLQTI
jgi:hypothetical protein